jgi:hypothetical protein
VAQGLEVIATSPHQWNGVALSPGGRMFASFPRWLDDETISVGEILEGGDVRPFPGGDWNTWRPELSPEDPGSRFVHVNAVHADEANALWVVDAATPRFGEVVPGGPKLVKIDLGENRVERIYPLDESIATPGSALNDVRVGAHHAYLSESGEGSIIILDLETGEARRRLLRHHSTQGDPYLVPVVEGRKMLDEEGNPPRLHANDIELTADGRSLLYQPITGPNWSLIATEALRNTALSDEQLGQMVETGNETMPLGGTVMDRLGNIYLMDVERRAIWKQRPDGTLSLIVRDPRLVWHDAPDIGPDGCLYVPVSQLHRLPRFNRGVNAVERPFCIYRVLIPPETA